MNGPCPLLALVNVLLLQEKITLNSNDEIVTSSQLMGFLGDIVLQAMPSVRSPPYPYIHMHDIIFILAERA